MIPLRLGVVDRNPGLDFDLLLVHSGIPKQRSMAHPHPQGPQPPASHVVPGAPGAVGPFPYMIEPPPLIPGLFVAEAIGAIRGGFNTQNLIIQDQYHAVNYGYTEMNKRFEEYVRQTDKILADQHGRFEQKLDDLRKEMRQFDTSQTAAIANLGARLNLLQDSTQASRDAMVSEIATIAKTMGHGFDGLAAMMRNCQYGEQFCLFLQPL